MDRHTVSHLHTRNTVGVQQHSREREQIKWTNKRKRQNTLRKMVQRSAHSVGDECEQKETESAAKKETTDAERQQRNGRGEEKEK